MSRTGMNVLRTIQASFKSANLLQSIYRLSITFHLNSLYVAVTYHQINGAPQGNDRTRFWISIVLQLETFLVYVICV